MHSLLGCSKCGKKLEIRHFKVDSKVLYRVAKFLIDDNNSGISCTNGALLLFNYSTSLRQLSLFLLNLHRDIEPQASNL